MTMSASIRTVKNSIINALLEAIFDILDADGKSSIINYAKLQYMKEKLPSNGETPYEDFIKLINAMNFLLAYSTKVLYEIGRKFAFYLSPFGTKLVEFFEQINGSLIDEMTTKIMFPDDNKIEIVLNCCPFCHGVVSIMPAISTQTQGFSCDFFRGLLYETIYKSEDRDEGIFVDHTSKGLNECKFEIVVGNKESSISKLIKSNTEKISAKLKKVIKI
jgi:predicted hydrocarbon binding protein